MREVREIGHYGIGRPWRCPNERSIGFIIMYFCPGNTALSVSVQSLRPQASAGKGSPRVWAVISSVR